MFSSPSKGLNLSAKTLTLITIFVSFLIILLFTISRMHNPQPAKADWTTIYTNQYQSDIVNCGGLVNTKVAIRSDGLVVVVGDNTRASPTCAVGNGPGLYYTSSADFFRTAHLMMRIEPGYSDEGYENIAFDKFGRLWVVNNERLSGGGLATFIKTVDKDDLFTGENPGGDPVKLNGPAGLQTMNPAVGSSMMSNTGKVYLAWGLYDSSLKDTTPISYQVLEYNPNGTYKTVNHSTDWKLCLPNDQTNCSGTPTDPINYATSLSNIYPQGTCDRTFPAVGVAPNDNVFVAYNWCENVSGTTRFHISAFHHISSQSWHTYQDIVSNSSSIISKVAAAADIYGNGYVFTNFTNTSTTQSPSLGLYKLIASNTGLGWVTLSNGVSAFMFSNNEFPKVGERGLSAVGTGNGAIWLAYQTTYGQVQYITSGANNNTNGVGTTGWTSGRIYSVDNGDGRSASISWWNNKLAASWMLDSSTTPSQAVRVAILDDGGFSKLPSPTSFTVTPVKNGSAWNNQLSWVNSSSLVANFKIDRDTNNASYPQIANPVAAVGTNNYTDTDGALTEDTKYFYRLTATSTGVTSSDPVTQSVLVPVNAPSNLSLDTTPFTDGTGTSFNVKLKWTNTSAKATNFRIARSTDSLNFTTVATPTVASGTTYTDSNQPDGTKLYYRVTAIDTNTPDGNGQPNTSAAATLNVTTPFHAPTIAATAISGSSIRITWSDVATNENGYFIFRSDSQNGTYAYTGSVPTNGQEYIDTGLANQTQYWYEVEPYNSAYTGPFSSADSAITGPTTPTNLVVTAVTNNSVSLQFTDSSTTETNFIIERRLITTTWSPVITLTSATSSQTGDPISTNDTSLNSGTLYFYRVRADNSGQDPTQGNGDSDYSNDASAFTLPSNSACIVTNTNDSGANTLRAALLNTTDCNKSGGVIAFNFPTAFYQSHTITDLNPQTELPALESGVTLAGFMFSDSLAPQAINIDGGSLSFPGLTLKGNNLVYGIKLQNFGGKPIVMAPGSKGNKLSGVMLKP